MNDQKKSKIVPVGSAGMRSAARPTVKRPVGKKKSRPSPLKKSEMSPLQLSMYKKMISKPPKLKFMTSGAAQPEMRGAQYPIKDSAQKAFSRNNF